VNSEQGLENEKMKMVKRNWDTVVSPSAESYWLINAGCVGNELIIAVAFPIKASRNALRACDTSSIKTPNITISMPNAMALLMAQRCRWFVYGGSTYPVEL